MYYLNFLSCQEATNSKAYFHIDKLYSFPAGKGGTVLGVEQKHPSKGLPRQLLPSRPSQTARSWNANLLDSSGADSELDRVIFAEPPPGIYAACFSMTHHGAPTRNGFLKCTVL